MSSSSSHSIAVWKETRRGGGERQSKMCVASRSLPAPRMLAALASAYLGGLPQHPLGHHRPVHLGYPLQRGHGSCHISRGHVVPRRLRDELKAERRQKAFLHLPVHATLPTASRHAQELGQVSTGHHLSWSSLLPLLLPPAVPWGTPACPSSP